MIFFIRVWEAIQVQLRDFRRHDCALTGFDVLNRIGSLLGPPSTDVPSRYEAQDMRHHGRSWFFFFFFFPSVVVIIIITLGASRGRRTRG